MFLKQEKTVELPKTENIYPWLLVQTENMYVFSEWDRINKLTSVFYASVLLLIINFVITLSK